MKNSHQKIIELNKELLRLSEAYYQNDNSLVDDAIYDKLYSQYAQLIKAAPNLEPKNSILKSVGFKPNNKFAKVIHKFPMLSLSNAFDEHDLLKFDKQIKDILHMYKDLAYIVEPKIDGVSISVIYKNGKLVQGITRGDGQVGEDVTHNISVIQDIPKKIKCKADLEVRGEIYLSHSTFNDLNKKENKFSNPRNAASGSLRQLDSNITKHRNLQSFLYSIPNPLDHNLTTHEQILGFLKSQGFATTKIWKKTLNIKEAISAVNDMKKIRNNLDYEIDGIVLKINNINLYEDIGYTVKFPKFMTAYKFPAEVASTELLDIFATIGRTGRVTYNAKLSPVKIAGSIVSAATLHNADYIREINVNIGDIVNVKKAGEIIPKVLGVKKKVNTKVWNESKVCPSCSSELTRYDGEVDQYCTNKKCDERLLAKFSHFVGRNSMNIEGLSVELLRLFISKGFITSFSSIFKLSDYKEQILLIKGFKEKSVNNILNSIEKAKNVEMSKFIFALGIRHVGSKNASILSKRFKSIFDIIQAKEDELESIRDVGPKVSHSLVKYFSSKTNVKQLHLIIDAGVNISRGQEQISDIFKGQTFVLTGSLSKPRGYYSKLITANGGNVSSSVSARTSYVVLGDNPGSKYTKAKELNVRSITEKQLLKLLGGNNE